MAGRPAAKAHWPNNWPKSLDYVYIDSGAMYRAITLYFLRNHIDWTKHQSSGGGTEEYHS